MNQTPNDPPALFFPNWPDALSADPSLTPGLREVYPACFRVSWSFAANARPRQFRRSGTRLRRTPSSGASSGSRPASNLEGWIELVFQPGAGGVERRVAGCAAAGAVGPGPDRLGERSGGAAAFERGGLANRADVSGLGLAAGAVYGPQAHGLGHGSGGAGVSDEAGGGGAGQRVHAKTGAERAGVFSAGSGREGTGGLQRFCPCAAAGAGAGGIEPCGVPAVV